MNALHKLEAKMADLFKGAPKLSNSSKETVVSIWPWLALIGGVLQLLAAWWLWSWARSASELAQYFNEVSRAYGGDGINERLTVWVWIGLITLIVDAVILLMAYPKLKRREKGGWDLLFLAGLINVVYAVVTLFFEGRGGLGSLLWNLIVSAVIFYLLFAVRDKYKGAAHHQAPRHEAKN